MFDCAFQGRDTSSGSRRKTDMDWGLPARPWPPECWRKARRHERISMHSKANVFLCYKVSHPTLFLFSAPTEAPRNVQVKQKSSTELEAIWEAPSIAHWNSEMLSYKIGYKWVLTMFEVKPPKFQFEVKPRYLSRILFCREAGKDEVMSYVEMRPSSASTSHIFLTQLKKYTRSGHQPFSPVWFLQTKS